MKITIHTPAASEAAALVCEGFRLWMPGKEQDSWRRTLEDFMLMDRAVEHWGSDCFTDIPMVLDINLCCSSCFEAEHNDVVDQNGIFIYYEPNLRVMAAASGVEIELTERARALSNEATTLAWRATVISSDKVEDGYYNTKNLLYQLQMASKRKLTEKASTTRLKQMTSTCESWMLMSPPRPMFQHCRMVDRT